MRRRNSGRVTGSCTGSGTDSFQRRGAEGQRGRMTARQRGSAAARRTRPAFRRSAEEEGAWVVVATTRPETMFGDIAVVHHPEDDRYAGLDGRAVEIPLSGVRIPVATSSV